MVRQNSPVRSMLVWFGAAFSAAILPIAAFAQDEGTVTYRMVEGDTLISIQERFLEGDNAFRRVQRLNRITNPRRIPVGSVIRLPRELLSFRPASLSVLEFSGTVSINGQPARRGLSLSEDAVIRTGRGGFVSLRSADGATISIPSNTSAQLVRSRIYALRNLRDVNFQILGGRGEVEAPTLREEERWRTSTPVAVTAVRGTVYRVAYAEDSGVSLTEVVEGAVEVAIDEDARLTPEGFGIAGTAAGLADVEQLLPPADIVDAGTTQTDENVVFNVSPPPGATSARTQIATDAGFYEIIAGSTADGEVNFGDLPDGRYFVRSRGIAASGLEGLSEASDFRRKRLGTDAQVDVSPIADGYRFTWLAVGEGPTHFAFQFWREGEAETPLFDEIALPGSATVLTNLEAGTYVWRVAAIQADPEEGLMKIWGPEQRLNVSGQ